MKKRFPVAVSLALVSLLLASSDAWAVPATPEASPVAIDVGDCTVEPRSTAELRELIRAELPRVIANLEGTPIADQETPSDYDPEAGVPADAATVAAVTETITQFVACSNAGHLPSVAALFTEQGAGAFLAFNVLIIVPVLSDDGTPTADIDPFLLDSYLGAIQVGVPLPAEVRLQLYAIEDVVQVENGRVLAFVTTGTGASEPAADGFLLREEDGRYRIIFGDEAEGEIDATPLASPVP